ncbi:hypothetical protein [Bradyrhizobium glycinis]|uniref:hypothetical protein n=1 Tax=Bradyrhizobium glycinis TaxID=2751812 RepID=UPI0018D85C21|nr:hypothetical protein [Bradyrhizobium glycinis]MBH5368673.1 hypothetical protein [Bradyrhizobium glycinis]
MSESPSDLNEAVPAIRAVDAIRAWPGMYVGDFPTGALLMARLVESLILLNVGPLKIEGTGAWYSIYADRDWLVMESGAVSLDPFQRLVPSGGRFYDRAEVILTVLADAVVTSDETGVTWITGEPGKWPLPADFDLSLPQARRRIVAFRHSELDPSRAQVLRRE